MTLYLILIFLKPLHLILTILSHILLDFSPINVTFISILTFYNSHIKLIYFS